MNCNEAQALLDPLLDSELSKHDAHAVQTHLQACPHCQDEFTAMKKLHDTLVLSERYAAPNTLSSSVKEQLDIYEFGLQSVSKNTRWSWLITTHSSAAMLGGWLIFVLLTFNGSAVPVNDELLTLHIKSLVHDIAVEEPNKAVLIQVQSSKQHTVKPWLSRRVDFSPPVINLSEQGFPLLGGRVEQLNDRNIAVLVYARRKHIINLFVDVKREHKQENFSGHSKNGYSIVSTQKGDFIYWAIADISIEELNELLSYFTGGVTATGL